MQKLSRPSPPLAALIQDRITHADNLRKRAQSPVIYVYFGVKVKDNLASRPKLGTNTQRFREDDQLPEGGLFWAYSLRELESVFERHTVKTGVNVWRWK